MGFITTISHWGKCIDEIQEAFNWLGAAADRVLISMLEEDIALMYIIMKKDEIIQRLDIKQAFVQVPV